jgi:hypothetical protein
LLVAEHGGPVMFARIGIMKALNHGKPNPAIAPRRKRAKAYRKMAVSDRRHHSEMRG